MTGDPSLVERILHAVPGGVVRVSQDGAIESANPEAVRILGLRFDEVTRRFVGDWAGETFFEDGLPCPPELYPVTKVLLTGAQAGPVTIGTRRADGPIVWAVFTALPLTAADGSPDGAIVTFLDITERKRAEEDLRESENRWRLLGENLPDFVIVVDREARILSINRILSDIPPETVVGSFAYDWLDEGDRPEWRRQFDLAVATGATTRTETRGRGPNGQVVWYDVVFAPIATSVDEKVIIVSRDMTERRRMLASLAEKERLASVGMLAASVAHEIMNPLTYVLANLDLALGDRVLDEARRVKALGEAREGARRMQQIVWDLRSLGRTGTEELFYVDARAVLETALRLSGPEVGRTARVRLELGEIPGVLASESRLCQVFINLLTNAAQAMDERPAAEREIVVRTRDDAAAGLVGVEIADCGVGISADRLERVFEPFYTTKRDGTGLGLSISRDIVEKMGGRIEVVSAPGEGTTFTVWLSTTRPREAR